MITQAYDDYKRDIENWDWPGLIADLQAQDTSPFEFDQIETESTFIGTVFALAPSGKYYVPYASHNVTDAQIDDDTAFYRALDDVAESQGCFIENGPDPCDILLVREIEND